MPTTKIFRNGNSPAVRIPSEPACEGTDFEMEVERVGDELRFRPARRLLAGGLTVFAKFAPDFRVDGRDEHEQADRAGGVTCQSI